MLISSDYFTLPVSERISIREDRIIDNCLERIRELVRGIWPKWVTRGEDENYPFGWQEVDYAMHLKNVKTDSRENRRSAPDLWHYYECLSQANQTALIDLHFRYYALQTGRLSDVMQGLKTGGCSSLQDVVDILSALRVLEIETQDQFAEHLSKCMETASLVDNVRSKVFFYKHVIACDPSHYPAAQALAPLLVQDDWLRLANRAQALARPDLEAKFRLQVPVSQQEWGNSAFFEPFLSVPQEIKQFLTGYAGPYIIVPLFPEILYRGSVVQRTFGWISMLDHEAGGKGYWMPNREDASIVRQLKPMEQDKQFRWGLLIQESSSELPLGFDTPNAVDASTAFLWGLQCLRRSEGKSCFIRDRFPVGMAYKIAVVSGKKSWHVWVKEDNSVCFSTANRAPGKLLGLRKF